jgi:hypothetical protein
LESLDDFVFGSKVMDELGEMKAVKVVDSLASHGFVITDCAWFVVYGSGRSDWRD